MINKAIDRPSPDIIAGYKGLLRFDSITCAISDCMGRFNAMTSDMRPIFEGIRLVGTALTVKTLASDLAAALIEPPAMRQAAQPAADRETGGTPMARVSLPGPQS